MENRKPQMPSSKAEAALKLANSESIASSYKDALIFSSTKLGGTRREAAFQHSNAPVQIWRLKSFWGIWTIGHVILQHPPPPPAARC